AACPPRSHLGGDHPRHRRGHAHRRQDRVPVRGQGGPRGRPRLVHRVHRPADRPVPDRLARRSHPGLTPKEFTMRTFFTDFRVGLFVLIGVALVVFGYFWTFDGVARGEAAYTLHLSVPNADGLYGGTPIKLAGVDIGALDDPTLSGGQAQLVLKVRAAYELPVDSHAALRSTGFLGDRYVAIVPGRSPNLLKDGDRIALDDDPADIEQIQRDAQAITGDLR